MDPHDVGVDVDPVKFQEAIDALLQRIPMTRDQYDELDASEQELAFTLANVAEADVVALVYDRLQSAVEDGTDFETFKAAVQDQLEESWGGEEPGRIETIFRTAVMTSYNDGRHQRMTSDAVSAARPYWRYDGIGGACPICEPCHDCILLASNPWWQRHYPILHPNCRDIVTALSKAEAEAEGIWPSPPSSPDPPDGFGTPPASALSATDDFEPDSSDYDGGIGDVLDDKLDDERAAA